MLTPTPLHRSLRQLRLLPIAAALLVSAWAGAQSAPPAPAAPTAPTAYAYRQDCAMHLYTLNIERIYQGRMRPLLYAIGVLRVEIDPSGQVSSLDWLRAPSHAPEVMADIERTIRQAAPFPRPAGPDKVAYTDTWLWDKSGQFQLDTLTEGQD